MAWTEHFKKRMLFLLAIAILIFAPFAELRLQGQNPDFWTILARGSSLFFQTFLTGIFVAMLWDYLKKYESR